jgi:methionine-rich copper-binding protein CopC
MMRNAQRFWPLLAAAILLPFHLKLDKSDPKADSALDASPQAVSLWFSQTVELSATKITLTDAAKQEITTKALTKAADGAVVATLEAPLATGKYNVSWRTMAKDGHVIKGDFAFSVK